MAGQAAPLSRALHSHQRLLAQSGRALVRSPAERQIRRGSFRSTRELETVIKRYLQINNQHPKPFVWTKTADQILDSVARFCQRTSGTAH
jgi:hypothetical protein